MPHHSYVEIFIETLSEMVAEERARKSQRALLQARAQAERFLSRLFGDETDGLRQPRTRANITLAPSGDQTGM